VSDVVTAPPFAYYGGKTTLAGRIADLLPEHRHYVEPFAGSLAVLLAKPPSPMETVNDLDGNLMTFWRVLREQPDDLARVCALTPHSRAEHQAAYDLEASPWVALTQGRGSRPALDIIRAYGPHDDVLIYADPPYLGTVRSSRQYAVEMSHEDEHADLLDALRACRAAVVLSGYASPLYDDALAGWERVELAAFTGQANTNGRRTEILWSNRPLGHAHLFAEAGT
jgi:DNA adenine methylase